MSKRTGKGDIYVMNANGSSQTKRVGSTGIDTEPAWHGSTIAFSTDRHGTANYELYSIPAAGGAETRLTTQAGNDITPAWSTDGKQIVFASNRAPATPINYELYTMVDPDQRQLRRRSWPRTARSRAGPTGSEARRSRRSARESGCSRPERRRRSRA